MLLTRLFSILIVAQAYLVVDACIHTEPYRRTEQDFDYKLYIMELAMEWVEEKCHVELSRSTYYLLCKRFFSSANYNKGKRANKQIT